MDNVRRHLQEALSQSRPELRASEQRQLLNHVIELIDSYKPGELTGTSAPIASDETLTWRKRSPAASSSARHPMPDSEPSLKAGRPRLLELAAHDLRNPISGILAGCQYLMEDAAGALEPHQTVVLSSIESSARLALHLIQALAEIPLLRLGTPELELGPIDILSVVQQSVSELRPVAETMKVELHVKAEEHTPTFSGDPAKLHEAFHGLMVNAIGFSPIGGNIEIVVGSRAGETTIALYREYTAPPGRLWSMPSSGPSAKAVRRKFSDAYAALLLTRARQIVRAHGGGLRVDSHGEYGQLWTVMLPTVLSQRTRSAEAKGGE